MPSLSTRLDVALVARGLAPSRTQAQNAIVQGGVQVNGKDCVKPGAHVSETDTITLAGSAQPAYVSRGGYKLAGALDAFGVNLAGSRCLDIGASTGGFTDCLLQRGAKHVTAIDVGSGQMVERLARDPRVTLHEHVNARYLADQEAVRGPFDLIVIDVSFISLTLILPAITSFAARTHGRIIALIKPQFEVGAGSLGPGGIVRDSALREHAVESVCASAEACGLSLGGVIESPIAGGDGNIEYLAIFSPKPER